MEAISDATVRRVAALDPAGRSKTPFVQIAGILSPETESLALLARQLPMHITNTYEIEAGPMKREKYEALDANGSPYIREAGIISELPWVLRADALKAALPSLAAHVGAAALRPLSFGVPVFNSFGLNVKQASTHAMATLLMQSGGSLSLEFVPAYPRASA